MRKNLITRQCGDLIHSVHLRFQRSNIQKFYQNSKCIPAWTVEKDSKRWSRQVVPSKKNRASNAKKKEKRNRTVLRTPPISLANTSIASSVGTKFDKHHSARNEPRKIEKRCNHFPFEMGWKYVKALFEPTLENWRWNLAKQRTESKRKIEFLHLARTQKKSEIPLFTPVSRPHRMRGPIWQWTVPPAFAAGLNYRWNPFSNEWCISWAWW